jgi:hypothetical protein
MKKKEIYSDEYRGVAFELVRWGTVADIGEDYVNQEFNPIWNIYLSIDTKRIPERHKPKSFLLRKKKSKLGTWTGYNYYKHPVLISISFHGGITFYEPREDGWIKVGCDYNHYQDHHSMYTFRYLLYDAHVAIDSFLTMVPDYKFWCCGNGKLYDKSEGVIRDNRFCSREYWEKEHPEWFVQDEEGKEVIKESFQPGAAVSVPGSVAS